jgi:hypothetical protein
MPTVDPTTVRHRFSLAVISQKDKIYPVPMGGDFSFVRYSSLSSVILQTTF